MLKPVRIAAPSATPVSLAEAKAQMRIDHSDDDTLIQALLAAATDHLDGYSGILGRALVTQTWRQTFPCFGSDERVLGLALEPVQSVEVSYLDANGLTQPLSASVYALRVDALGPYLALNTGQSWPEVYSAEDAVTVDYVAGYGPPAAVPAAIRQAVLLLAAHWYENREAVGPGDVSNVPLTFANLIAPWRRTCV